MIEKIIALLQSRTNLSAIVVMVSGTLLFFGVDLHLTDPDVQEKILAGATALGGLAAFVYRTIAKKKIGGAPLE